MRLTPGEWGSATECRPHPGRAEPGWRPAHRRGPAVRRHRRHAEHLSPCRPMSGLIAQQQVMRPVRSVRSGSASRDRSVSVSTFSPPTPWLMCSWMACPRTKPSPKALALCSDHHQRLPHSNTTVRIPSTSTRSSRCQRTAWASTRRSTSRPIRTISSTPSRWEMWATSWLMIGPPSSSAVT